MSEQLVTYESSNSIAVISLNRPEKLNALSSELGVELLEAWKRYNASDDKVAIFTGAGDRAFSVGADLTNPPELWKFMPNVGIDIEKPLIAAVHGHVIGGAVCLVQYCDLCIAADNTKFSYPESKIGVSGGLISSIVERMPHKVAMEFIYGLEDMSAERAYEVGFVNKVVPRDQLMEETLAYAGRLAELAPMVLSMLKRFTNECLGKGPTELAGIARRQSEALTASNDFLEGRNSFKEKRKAVFTGT
jgi:enoyl-CoA hydratase/carnithine racemase